ncbi:beta-1,3-galactosyltransferase 4 [Procambarus clarkii]|uniref:beta-1,3-galactosyltransferase 4 n=1 Tax=Procambarus clarkii TaxID=6728 RepID=UPI003742CC7B
MVVAVADVVVVGRRRGRKFCGSCLKFLVFLVALVPVSLVVSGFLSQLFRENSRQYALRRHQGSRDIVTSRTCHGSVHTQCPDELDREMLKHFLTTTRKKRTSSMRERVREYRDLNMKLGRPPAFLAPRNLSVRYFLLETAFCSIPDIQMIFYVHTAPANQERREVIRDTWGSPEWYPILRHKVVFVLGWTTSNESRASLRQESDIYHDLIMADFVDSYRNLSYKAVTALHWVSQHCRQPGYVIKTDDDIFVNIFALKRFLDYSLNFTTQTTIKVKDVEVNETKEISTVKPGNAPADANITGKEHEWERPEIQCLVWIGMMVIRDNKSKWYVDPNEYKPNTFPPYCSGNAFFMTQPAVYALMNASLTCPFLWVDDVYLTGVLAEAAKVPHVHRNSLYELDGNKFVESLIAGNKVFLHHPQHDADTRREMWKLLLEKEVPQHAHT